MLQSGTKWQLSGMEKAGAKMTMVAMPGKPFEKAMHIETKRRPQERWTTLITAEANMPVQKGDVLLTTFYARAISKVGETAFCLENNVPPFAKSIEQPFRLTNEWKRYKVAFGAIETLGAPQIGINFRLGYDPQIIEIGNVEITNYGNKASIASLQ